MADNRYVPGPNLLNPVSISNLPKEFQTVVNRLNALYDNQSKINGNLSTKQEMLEHVNTANPHGINKTDMGLGSVENFGVASPAEAEAGTADNKYMTPLKSRQGFLKMKSGLFDNQQRFYPVDNEKYVTPAVLNDFTNGHLQFGRGKPIHDRKLSDLIWIINDPTSQLAFKKAGIIYRVDEAFTTTSDFVEGAGFSYPKDTLIRMVQTYGGAFKYTVYNLATDINYNATKNVKEAIEDLENKLLGVYSPKGNKTATELLAITPDISNLNFVWNVTEPFTTTDKFVEGVGIDYPAGTNVAVLKIGSEYKFDILGGIYNKAEDIIYNDSNVKDEITNLKTTKADLSDCVEKEVGKELIPTLDLQKLQAIDSLAETIETSVVIDTADWVADGPTATYKAVKTVSGVLLSDNPIISFDLTGIADTAWNASRTEFAKIGLASTTDNDEITFYASAIPSEDITITVKVVR